MAAIVLADGRRFEITEGRTDGRVVEVRILVHNDDCTARQLFRALCGAGKFVQQDQPTPDLLGEVGVQLQPTVPQPPAKFGGGA